MEPALALALVLAGFATALVATIAKLAAELCAAAKATEPRDARTPPTPAAWVAVAMPGGDLAVARQVRGDFLR